MVHPVSAFGNELNSQKSFYRMNPMQPTDKMDIGGRQSQSAKTANTAPNDSGAAKKTILNRHPFSKA